MRESNHPDKGLAQEWLQDLGAWIDAHGLTGYDPFDVKAHPLIRAMQPYALPRKTATAICDVFPYLTRRALGVRPTLNAKGAALTAMGWLRLYQTYGDRDCLDRAAVLLETLRSMAAPCEQGLAWGYPFKVFGKGVDIPAGVPVAVVTVTAGEAFLLAHEAAGDAAALDAAANVGRWLLHELPRLDAGDGKQCFAYAVSDRRRTHNVNLLAAAFCIRLADRLASGFPGRPAATPEALRDAADSALAWSLEAQHDDGSWPYGVAGPGAAADPKLMTLVDHHHTGFVLRALLDIWSVTQDAAVESAMRRGWDHYRKRLYAPDGMPVNGFGRYPVDIHACAEGILCPSALSAWRGYTLRFATRTLRWSHFHMRDPRNGLPYYRKYPFFTSRLLCTRWGLAWMFRALAEYLHRMELADAAAGSGVRDDATEAESGQL